MSTVEWQQKKLMLTRSSCHHKPTHNSRQSAEQHTTFVREDHKIWGPLSRQQHHSTAQQHGKPQHTPGMHLIRRPVGRRRPVREHGRPMAGRSPCSPLASAVAPPTFSDPCKQLVCVQTANSPVLHNRGRPHTQRPSANGGSGASNGRCGDRAAGAHLIRLPVWRQKPIREHKFTMARRSPCSTSAAAHRPQSAVQRPTNRTATGKHPTSSNHAGASQHSASLHFHSN